MGPLGVRLAPYGRVRPEDAFEAYREQAAALADGGVDLLVVETQTDLREMEQALAAARAGAPALAVVVSATFTKDDRTLLGSIAVAGRRSAWSSWGRTRSARTAVRVRRSCCA